MRESLDKILEHNSHAGPQVMLLKISLCTWTSIKVPFPEVYYAYSPNHAVQALAL